LSITSSMRHLFDPLRHSLHLVRRSDLERLDSVDSHVGTAGREISARSGVSRLHHNRSGGPWW
jgi:hypothetical protein